MSGATEGRGSPRSRASSRCVGSQQTQEEGDSSLRGAQPPPASLAPTSAMLQKGTVPLGAAMEKRGSRKAGRPWGMLPVSVSGWDPITWKE